MQADPDPARNIFDRAVQSHRRGDVRAAEELFRKVVQLNPGHVNALHRLGMIACQAGQNQTGARHFAEIVRLRPGDAQAHYHLGLALHALGKIAEARDSWQTAVRLDPNHADARNNLGNTMRDEGRFAEAADCYRETVRIKPGHAVGHCNLGYALAALGRHAEAEASFRQALRLQPDHARAHHGLAVALAGQGRTAGATASLRQAVRLGRENPRLLVDIGLVFEKLGRTSEAMDCHRAAARIRPDFAVAHHNLGSLLFAAGQLTAAVQASTRAVELEPTFADARLNLGVALARRGQVDQAVLQLEIAAALEPNSTVIWNSYLHTLHYSPGTTLRELFVGHGQFNALHAAPLRARWRPHDNDRDPGRRLRIGFVSPNFALHPVGYFLIRLLENLDRGETEAVCYSDTRVKDAMTARLATASAGWFDAAGLTDTQLAEKIRSDRIDILFDLAGHTGGNRLLVFARKPAPVQITWLDYVGTTGLAAIDYILADAREIPPESERWYAEKVLRMPDGYVCHEPQTAEVPADPALDRFTFGSFNLLNKISIPTLRAWVQILQRLPESNLLIKYRGLEDAGTADRFRRFFADRGTDPSRVGLEGGSPHGQMPMHYRRIKIALDPFPYNGGLTTCEALAMGVPVITCPGETFAARHGLSHLTTAGLTETIARDPAHYVDLAVELARDNARREVIAGRLRRDLAASPLCDGPRFAANFQSLMRRAWRDWLEP